MHKSGNGVARVLVVEDFDDARELYCELFAGQGFEVHSAADGLAGLELARSIVPDAIVLDVSLPKLDGLSVLSAVRNDPILKNTPVIVVTAHATQQIKARAISLGASRFITKPCLPDVLVRELRAALFES